MQALVALFLLFALPLFVAVLTARASAIRSRPGLEVVVVPVVFLTVAALDLVLAVNLGWIQV